VPHTSDRILCRPDDWGQWRRTLPTCGGDTQPGQRDRAPSPTRFYPRLTAFATRPCRWPATWTQTTAAARAARQGRPRFPAVVRRGRCVFRPCRGDAEHLVLRGACTKRTMGARGLLTRGAPRSRPYAEHDDLWDSFEGPWRALPASSPCRGGAVTEPHQSSTHSFVLGCRPRIRSCGLGHAAPRGCAYINDRRGATYDACPAGGLDAGSRDGCASTAAGEWTRRCR